MCTRTHINTHTHTHTHNNNNNNNNNHNNNVNNNNNNNNNKFSSHSGFWLHSDFKLALTKNQDRAEALLQMLIKQIAALRSEINALIARYAWVWPQRWVLFFVWALHDISGWYMVDCTQAIFSQALRPAAAYFAISLLLRYINCRNANWKIVQLCRSVLRAVFDVFHFVSASLVYGVSFSFVLHGWSQQWVKT